MKSSKVLLIFFCILIISSLVLPENSNAIPAFARRYKVSCTTCHSVFPKLKDYGDEFAGSGFIIKEKENKRDYVSAGDDLLWLNRDFPIAGRMDLFTSYDEGKDVESDFQIPWGIKLLSGGTLYKNIGYYFYFYLQERGEVAGIEDAYIHFDNIFKTNLDVMVGQFQVCDPLMKRELRLTYDDYMIYKTNIGSSNINLAYERGLMFAYGIDKTKTDLIAMVVNGNGKPEGGENRKLDQDNYKNIGLRINQSIGDYLTIGGFYYGGKEKASYSDVENEVIYYGPDFTFGLRSIQITAQYLYRKDTNPLFYNSNPKEIETDGYVVEMMYAPDIETSRYYFTGLYNLIDSNALQYETATLSYSYLIARNLRLLTEYTYDIQNEKNKLIFGLVSAF